jgi:uncharacterized protein
VWFVVALSVALVAYNAALNLVPFPRWTYVPLNLLLAGALLLLARSRGISWGALGLARTDVSAGLRWGLGAAVVVVVTIAAGVAIGDRVAIVGRLLADERAAGISGIGLLYETLIRIPLGTAVFEEVAFRGVLLAEISRDRSVLTAVVISSIVFGLWHIGPSLATIRLNDPGVTWTGEVIGVSAAVGVTTVAGVLFCWLRLASGSLLAPILAHWATNAIGLGGAVYSRRGV